MKFKAVLVPLDLAEPNGAEFSIPQAVELARAGNGSLTLMTVVPESWLLFEGVSVAFQLEEVVNKARARLAQLVLRHDTSGVRVEQEVRVGSIVREILNIARERSIDLIVLPSHQPQMRDYLIGPNAAQVVQRAHCSVLVLKPDLTAVAERE